MRFAEIDPSLLGAATLSPSGSIEAGSMAELVVVFTAGFYGVDDSGMLKLSWRTTSDMARPQFDRPEASAFTSIEASNGAVLRCRFDRNNLRPWTNTINIQIEKGFLRAGDTITIRMGDRRRGSPGIRLQTNAERFFEFRLFVDPFATYRFFQLGSPLGVSLTPGPAARWRAIVPSTAAINESFRLAIVAEDRWGNPTPCSPTKIALESPHPVSGLPRAITHKGFSTEIDGIVTDQEGDVTLNISDESGRLLCSANPLRIVSAVTHRRYWGDLHGQSEETVGTNSADDYFAFARDLAFVDIVGHQGNDFQISDAFWDELNRLTGVYTVTGRFLAIPGYEWSGNTGLGGDHNVFYRDEGRPIHRSSQVLLGQDDAVVPSQATSARLFSALQEENAIVIAHVGGRYADLAYAHDAKLETSVEIHSTWGTFEWLLQDALRLGYRVGVVCHSDDHKGRPGSAMPGASSFGAIGGLTCYLMPDLTRDSLFAALRNRHHYGTTGARIFLSVVGKFDHQVDVLERDQTSGLTLTQRADAVMMGDIVRGASRMKLFVDVVGHRNLERVDIICGDKVAASVKPSISRTSKRIGVRWEGAEYRGRGRETRWEGEIHLEGNKFTSAKPVNFLNPELPFVVDEAEQTITWTSITTGNMAGIDLDVIDGGSGKLKIHTTHAEAIVDLAELGGDPVEFEAGGLARKVSVRRLCDTTPARSLAQSFDISYPGGRDLPVYVRVTQEDCHQAWSSPIYLVT